MSRSPDSVEQRQRLLRSRLAGEQVLPDYCIPVESWQRVTFESKGVLRTPSGGRYIRPIVTWFIREGDTAKTGIGVVWERIL